MRLNWTALALAAMVLGGCAVTPDTITHQRPGSNTQYAQPAVGANGAIFHQNAYRPIFEDHKARLVGDNITIVITESNRATKAGSDSGERANSANIDRPRFFQQFV